jgi:hypothetical protein
MEAIKATKAKNANAFRQKISSGSVVNSTHAMGCRCKKSFCLKKYCECYEAGVFCGEKCRCNQCANLPKPRSSPARRAQFADAASAAALNAQISSSSEAPSPTPLPATPAPPKPTPPHAPRPKNEKSGKSDSSIEQGAMHGTAERKGGK